MPSVGQLFCCSYYREKLEDRVTKHPSNTVKENRLHQVVTMYPDLIVQGTHGLTVPGQEKHDVIGKKNISSASSLTTEKPHSQLSNKENNNNNNNRISGKLDEDVTINSINTNNNNIVDKTVVLCDDNNNEIGRAKYSNDVCATLADHDDERVSKCRKGSDGESKGEITCSFSSVNTLASSSKDEGQLQCALKYDRVSGQLVLHSVCVQLLMANSSNPGLYIEVSLLPRGSEVLRSKVYMTATKNVQLTLRDVLRLHCSNADLSNATLAVSVKPVIGCYTLYAETDLKDLALESGSEIYIGGYLRTIAAYTS